MNKYISYLFNKNKFAFIFIFVFLFALLLTSVQKVETTVINGITIYYEDNINFMFITIPLFILSSLSGLYVRYPLLSKQSVDFHLSTTLSKEKMLLSRFIVVLVYILSLIILLTLSLLVASICVLGTNLKFSAFFLFMLTLSLICILQIIFSTSVLMLTTSIPEALSSFIFIFGLPVILGLFLNIISNIDFENFLYFGNFNDYFSSQALSYLNNHFISVYENVISKKDEINFYAKNIYDRLTEDLSITSIPYVISIVLFSIIGIISLKTFKPEDSEEVNTSVFNYFIPLTITYFLFISSLTQLLKDEIQLYFIYTIIATGLYYGAIMAYERKAALKPKHIIVSIVCLALSLLFLLLV